jgi:hypothetical protein
MLVHSGQAPHRAARMSKLDLREFQAPHHASVLFERLDDLGAGDSLVRRVRPASGQRSSPSGHVLGAIGLDPEVAPVPAPARCARRTGPRAGRRRRRSPRRVTRRREQRKLGRAFRRSSVAVQRLGQGPVGRAMSHHTPQVAVWFAHGRESVGPVADRGAGRLGSRTARRRGGGRRSARRAGSRRRTRAGVATGRGGPPIGRRGGWSPSHPPPASWSYLISARKRSSSSPVTSSRALGAGATLARTDAMTSGTSATGRRPRRSGRARGQGSGGRRQREQLWIHRGPGDAAWPWGQTCISGARGTHLRPTRPAA